MLADAVSAVAPGMADVSAWAVTVHVPTAVPVTVNAEPEGCHPGGVAAQVGSADWSCTGIDSGVPAGTAFAFVSVACAVSEPVAPTLIVAGAPVIVT